MLVAFQLFVSGLYLPPVFKWRLPSQLRPRRSFRCQSTLPCDSNRAVGALVVLVAVQLFVPGLYLPPVFKSHCTHLSSPDDHFIASPHCRVTGSGSGRVGGAGGCPTIRAGIVSPAGVQITADIISSPDDHFTASPHGCVIASASRRVDSARGCPTIRARDCIFRRCSSMLDVTIPPQTIISLPVHTAV